MYVDAICISQHIQTTAARAFIHMYVEANRSSPPSPYSLHPWPVISCCCVKKQIKNIIPLTHFLLSGLLTNRPTTRHERQGDYINRADDPNSKRSEAKTLTTA